MAAGFDFFKSFVKINKKVFVNNLLFGVATSAVFAPRGEKFSSAVKSIGLTYVTSGLSPTAQFIAIQGRAVLNGALDIGINQYKTYNDTKFQIQSPYALSRGGMDVAYESLRYAASRINEGHSVRMEAAAYAARYTNR